VCAKCGSVVSVTELKPNMAIFKRVEVKDCRASGAVLKEPNYHNFTRRHCTVCKSDDHVYLVQIPRVFRYLCSELSSVNIRVQLQIEHPMRLKNN